MSLTKACCTLPPVESDYTPHGTESTFEDGQKVYEIGTGNRILICVYDIFGFHPVTKQVCDRLSTAGFRLVMPDFWRGKPWKKENFPPPDFSVLVKWATTEGNWDSVVKPDLEKVVKHYKAQGAVSFGIFGFCWGGKISAVAVQDLSESISAATLIHPSFLELSDAEKIKKPTLVIPSKDEADLTPFYEILKKNLGAEKCGYIKMGDMHHGYCAARGDLTNPLNRQRIDETIKAMAEFFDKNLK